MAELGNLNFGVHLKNYTPQEYEKIKKQLMNMQAKIHAKLGLKFDEKAIEQSIERMLRGKKFKADIEIGKIDIDRNALKEKMSEVLNKNKIKLDIDGGDARERLKQYWQRRGISPLNRTKTGKELYDEMAVMRFNKSVKDVNSSFLTQQRLVGNLSSQIAGVYSIYSIERFIRGLYTIGGEFQKQRIALTSIIGSETKATELFDKLKQFSVVSPFQFGDLVSQTKQLAAYGVQYEELYETARRLGDISAGVGVDMGRIILAYGQVRSAAFLRGQELRQFTEAGIPLVDELAKRFTILEKRVVSAGEVFDKISKKEVSFDMVKDVLWGLTDEGGKFYNLQEKLSESLAGKWSNLQDAWSVMMADIAEGNNGVLSDSIDLATRMTQNWQSVADVIKFLVVTYGTYKAVVITLSAVEKSRLTATLALGAAEKSLTAWQGLRFTATQRLVAIQKALNTTMLANPYAIVGVAAAALVYTIYRLATAETAAEAAARKHKEAQEQLQNTLNERRQRINSLLRVIQDETETEFSQIEAYEQLKVLSPALTQAYSREELAVASLTETTKKLNEERDNLAYGDIIKNIDRIKKSIKDYENTIERLQGVPHQGRTISAYYAEIENLREELKLLQSDLDKANRLRKEAEEGKLPVNEQLIKAQLDLEQIGSEFEKAKKRLQEEQKRTGLTEIVIPLRVEEGVPSFGFDGMDFGALSDFQYWQKRYKEQQGKVSQLQASQTSAKNYQQAYKEAKENWHAKIKALRDAKNGTEEEYRNALEELGKAEQNYKDLGGITDSEKQSKEVEKRKENLQKIADELLSIRRKNQQDEISLMEEGNEKALMEIESGFEARRTEIEKQAHELAKRNKEAGVTTTDSGTGLTSEQQAEIDKANELNVRNREKQEADIYKAGAAAMRNYLKEYGTFQQQKLAIAEEYAERIWKAQNEGERLSLEKQRDAAMLGVDVEAAKQSIDWQSVFGDLGLILKEQIQPTIDNLKRITQSDGFRNSPIESQQKLYDILSQLEQQSGTLGKDMFKDVARDLELYRRSLNAYHSAQQREIGAANELTAAQNRLRDAQENGGNIEEAQKAVDEAKERFSQASESVKTLGDKANENAEVLQTSSAKARGALEGLAEGLNKLKSGSLSQAFEGVKDIGKVVGGKLGDAIANIDPAGIISGVLSILDILKDGVSSIFVSLQDTLFGAIEGILNDLFSGDIIVKPIKNTFSHIGNIVNTLTFGGFNSLFGSNAKEVAETTNRLTESNERLKKAVDSLKSEISKTGGKKSIDAAEQARKDQEAVIRQTSQILQTQMGYYGAHHSNAYYWGLTKQDYASLNASLNDYKRKNPLADIQTDKVGSLADIYKLTPEQMDYIRTSNIEMWEKMISQGKYDKSEYWENYADLAGSLEDITDSLNEALTQITFDDLRSSFISSLMDMDKSAEDFADDFSKYLMNAVLNAKISDVLDAELEEFYKEWAEAAKSDGELDEEEADVLKKRWDAIVQKGMELRNQASAITGYTGETSTSGMSKSGIQASEETMNLTNSYLNGIRLDVSAKRMLLEKIGNDILPKYNVLAEAQLTQLRAIADNTLRSARNTEANVAVLQEVRDVLHSVVGNGQKGKGIKIV